MPARREATPRTHLLPGFLRGPMTSDKRLLSKISKHNIRAVEELITDGGASVDGSADLEVQPIALAAFQGQVDIMELLLERGANLEVAAPGQRFGVAGNSVFTEGWRPLHAAVHGGQLAAIDTLLQAGADPNATDSQGETPLITACSPSTDDIDPEETHLLVQALLDGGADASLAQNMGRTALHHAARRGATGVMEILLRSAPSTVNLADMSGCSALFYYSALGHRMAVSLLLSAGASEKAALAKTGRCALLGAVEMGQENVLRLLLHEGLEAVGGMQAISVAVEAAIEDRRPACLRMLLAAKVGAGVGEEYWANKTLKRARVPPLHSAAAVGSLATVRMLLAAGADETALSSDGKRACDCIGRRTRGDRDAAREAAIGRMLERGPAFRARSWAWLVRVNSSSAAIAAAPEVPLGARIYRPEGKPVFPARFTR